MKILDYADVDYSKLTINDKNFIKRKLQRKRLLHAIAAMQNESPEFEGSILDFGAGSGELCKNLSSLYPKCRIICYEPSIKIRQQAIENVKGIQNIVIAEDLQEYRNAKYDYIFCLEVLEHLPDEELKNAMTEIIDMSQNSTRITFGVPNEIFIAALLKGIFRLSRRYGEVDARIGNILKAFSGFPPTRRETVSFDGLPYIIRHMGFNHRKFTGILEDHLNIEKMYGSPFQQFPIFMSFEIYYICKIKD